jgi:hypothetical protein
LTTTLPRPKKERENDTEKVRRKPVPLAMTFDELLGGDITPDETADDIIRAVREMRDTPSKSLTQVTT